MDTCALSHLFSFPKQHDLLRCCADVLKSSLKQLPRFLSILSNLGNIIVVLEMDKLRVFQCVFNIRAQAVGGV